MVMWLIFVPLVIIKLNQKYLKCFFAKFNNFLMSIVKQKSGFQSSCENHIPELRHSMNILSVDLQREFFEYKMNIQQNYSFDSIKNLPFETFEFLCELIDKQHLYIQELESKYEKLLADFTNKQRVLKDLNTNVINRFIKSNYDQEVMISKLKKENDNLNEEIRSLSNTKLNTISSQRNSTPLKHSNEDSEATISSSEKKLIQKGNEKVKKFIKSSAKKSCFSGKKTKAINVYQFHEKMRDYYSNCGSVSSSNNNTLNTTSSSNVGYFNYKNISLSKRKTKSIESSGCLQIKVQS